MMRLLKARSLRSAPPARRRSRPNRPRWSPAS